MPKVVIEQSHSLDASEVRKRLDTLSEKLSSKYGIDAHWKNDNEATFKRTGASGSIVCQPGKVTVNVDLSLVLSPMKHQVETRIRSELEKVLA